MLLGRHTLRNLRKSTTSNCGALATLSTRWSSHQKLPPPPPRFSNAATAAVALGLGGLSFAHFFDQKQEETTTNNNNNNNNNMLSSTLLPLSLVTTQQVMCAKQEQFFSRADVAKHKTPEEGIWVTYKDGVYDITDFVQSHPGGSKRIMMAAGGRIDPFWQLYQQHLDTKVIDDVLMPLRIGTLNPDEPKIKDDDDPYANEPERHPALVVRKIKPFNAESPIELLTESYLTPNALWYTRHHHPVPVVDPKEFRLGAKTHTSGTFKTNDMSFDDVASLTLEDIQQQFTKHEVTATMQCGGNRRSGHNTLGKTEGLNWSIGAISTAKFGELMTVEERFFFVFFHLSLTFFSLSFSLFFSLSFFLSLFL